MPFTEATAHKILNKILKNTDFTHPTGIRVSLHTDDPGATGANEVAGGDYERKEPTLGGPAAKVIANSDAMEWENMPACTVEYVGLWDTEATPNFWWGGALTVSKTLGAGDTFRLAVGALTVTLT